LHNPTPINVWRYDENRYISYFTSQQREVSNGRLTVRSEPGITSEIAMFDEQELEHPKSEPQVPKIKPITVQANAELTDKSLPKLLISYITKLIISHNKLSEIQQRAMLVKLELALSEWNTETAPSPPSISTEISLTTSQQQALIKLKEFATSKNIRYFRLIGYAGTGKSFLIAEFIKWLKVKKIDHAVAAPTNKAAKNIKLIGEKAGVTVNAMTVAQLLGQQPRLNEATGIEEFTVKSKLKLDFNIIIIDEFSMISSTNFTELEKAIGVKTKVVFVGDAAQLPPVGESEPIVSTTPLIANESILTEIVRYDGEIGKVAEQMRTDKCYRTNLYPFQSTSDESIICLPYQEWLNEAAKLIKSSAWQADSNYCRILVWRNNTAESLNNWIRLQLWGTDALPFKAGDRLIAKKPVFRESKSQGTSSIKKKKEWNIIVNNSEECEVIGDYIPNKNSQLRGCL
jgi:DNA replication protein DnaC